MNELIVKGNFIYTKDMDCFTVLENSYLVAIDGRIEGIYKELPSRYRNLSIEDYGDRLIIPGMVDLHVHASQYLQMGLGMSEHLLEWLKEYTFELEKRFQDLNFAKEAYQYFVDDLVACGTLHAYIYATSSTEATEVLFELLKEKGIGAYVGKVNMDQNAPDAILESTEESLKGTRYLIRKYRDERLVKPILTPRFAPSCTQKLLDGLGKIAEFDDLPVQSHLSETKKEVEWAKELFPDAKNYLDIYGRSGLLGRALMAHAIYLDEEEISQVKTQDVLLVHCPDSNINIRSGIMPVRKYLNRGLKIGLGSDVAGGHRLAINEAMIRAIQLSKLVSLQFPELESLKVSEAFYMGTKAGGTFFGNTGSFEVGYSFDALVIEDHPLIAELYSIEDRLEKFIYSGTSQNICARYVEGKQI
jgi:guanine deaminase